MKQKVFEKNGLCSRNPLPKTLSEETILHLQAMFITPGFHALYVQDIATGRAIIKSQLEALNWYHSVGCLVTHADYTFSYAHNIIHDLKHSIIDTQIIESFFLDVFYYDFLWIELTTELEAMTWIKDFETQLLTYRLDETIPIIVVYYP